jgi:hypothetical protein
MAEEFTLNLWKHNLRQKKEEFLFVS